MTAPAEVPRPATKERPLIFSAPMVRAILDGRKSQTRRVVSDSTSQGNFRASELLLEQAFADPGPSPAGNPGPYLHAPVNCPAICARHGWTADECDPAVVERLYPRWFPGDRLWVRETFHVNDSRYPWHYDSMQPGETLQLSELREKTVYRAGPEPYSGVSRWTSPMRMPRWASRITLEITGVRIERLQEISEVDAIAEGVSVELGLNAITVPGASNLDDGYDCARDCYADYWDSLNARPEHSWQSNPWVWVIAFKRVAE